MYRPRKLPCQPAPSHASHAFLYVFLSQLQKVTVDSMADADVIRRGIEIRRPKKNRNIQNDVRIKSCIERYVNGAYSRLQFLKVQSGCPHRGFPGDVRRRQRQGRSTSQSSTPLRMPLLPSPSLLSLHPMTCARGALSNIATG